jgi:hypothetical protein
VPEPPPDTSGEALINAVYRHAFPDVPDTSLLAHTRKLATAYRLGLAKATEKDKRELRQSLRLAGLDRSMLAAVRHRSVEELALLLHHAYEVFTGDVERSTAIPLMPPDTPQRFGRPMGRPAERAIDLGQAFNRAGAEADADLAAIDQAIIAVTGQEPPRGRSR